ncbi:MAG: H-X9-DG-CTERM domain-containing protein [Phycisphaerae bacterium]
MSFHFGSVELSSIITGGHCCSIERHGDGINVAFADGHVQHEAIKNLWSLHWAEGWVTDPPASVNSLR